jgi:hypothetical protein
MQAVCPPRNTPAIFVSPATFPPTERLTAPASYLPCAVVVAMSAARGPRSAFTIPSRNLGLVAVPGPVTKIPQHGGTGDRRVVDPSAEGGMAQCAGAALRHIPLASGSVRLMNHTRDLGLLGGPRREATNDGDPSKASC